MGGMHVHVYSVVILHKLPGEAGEHSRWTLVLPTVHSLVFFVPFLYWRVFLVGAYFSSKAQPWFAVWALSLVFKAASSHVTSGDCKVRSFRQVTVEGYHLHCPHFTVKRDVQTCPLLYFVIF